MKPIEGGAAAVGGDASEIQFAFGNSISLMQAQGRNIDLRIVTEESKVRSWNANSTSAIMVAKGKVYPQPWRPGG